MVGDELELYIPAPPVIRESCKSLQSWYPPDIVTPSMTAEVFRFVPVG